MTDIRLAARAFVVFAAVLSWGRPVLAQGALVAKATLNSCIDGTPVGTATLTETPSTESLKDVTIQLSIQNLVAGKHAVHIHEVAACTPTCAAAGSHLDLGPFGNNVPVTANHPYHSGDLINVNVAPDGTGFMAHITSRVSLAAGPLSLFDANGASLVIHALPDIYCLDPTDPNCAGGGRVACGAIGPAAALPTISALTATPNVLWPPNGKLVPVTIGVAVSDPVDPAPVCQIAGVTSNEPVTAADAVVTGPLTVSLSAVRNSAGTGRSYSITVNCTNNSQLSTTATVDVLVPRDQR